MLDCIPTLPSFNTSDIELCHRYLREHGEVAGYSLLEFEQTLNPETEVPVNEIEQMVQAVFDEIE